MESGRCDTFKSWESYEVDLFYLGAAGICMSAALVGGQLEQKLEMPVVR